MSDHEKVKLTTVYKKNGKMLKVNDNSLKFIGELGLSKDKPKTEADIKAKAEEEAAKKAKAEAEKKAKDKEDK